jgi:hypothetical protein
VNVGNAGLPRVPRVAKARARGLSMGTLLCRGVLWSMPDLLWLESDGAGHSAGPSPHRLWACTILDTPTTP